MPELPEVETVCRELASPTLFSTKIKNVIVSWPRTIACPGLEEFQTRIKGTNVLAVSRRGKYIILKLSSGQDLVIHLRMTGQFYYAKTSSEDPYVRVRLILDNQQELCFKDTRKFGRWYLVDNHEEITSKLGPEPFDPLLTASVFHQALRKRKRQLKALLLDQEFIAGIGNIYADEALFESRLHPLQTAHKLNLIQATNLLESIRVVLNRGLKNLGTSLGRGQTNYYSVAGRRGRNQDSLRVFRRTGDPCDQCSEPIRRIIVAQRSTHFCPTCQKKRKS